MRLSQLRDQLIKRDLALGGDAGLDPLGRARQLALPAAVALPPRRQRPGFMAEPDQILDELRGHPEMTPRFVVPVAFIDIPSRSRSQLYRM